MRKILILIGLLVFVLCGCNSQKPEESWTLDFDELDKEFGQYQEDAQNNSEEYEDEMDNLYLNVEEYVGFIMKDDARALVNSFSTELISFLADANGVSYDAAKEIARERILETFNKTDIKELYDAWRRGNHKIEITKISIFPQRAELKEAYLSCGIKITDAVEVEFKVMAGDDERQAKIRLIKHANGGWGADADYFF